MFRSVREQPPQVPIVEIRMLDPIMGPLALVVLAQRFADRTDWFESGPRGDPGLFPPHLGDHLADVAQLFYGRPVTILGTPAGPGLQPHGERFRKVFYGMALRIPGIQMQDEFFAVRLGLVVIRVRCRGFAKHFSPAAAAAESVGVVDGMPRFVPQNLHAPVFRTTLDLQHQFPLEFHQAGMSQIEGDRHARDAVRREPFVREPKVGSETDFLPLQFLIQPLNTLLQRSPLNSHLEVTHPHIQ